MRAARSLASAERPAPRRRQSALQRRVAHPVQAATTLLRIRSADVDATVMLQREVADRAGARAGHEGLRRAIVLVAPQADVSAPAEPAAGRVPPVAGGPFGGRPPAIPAAWSDAGDLAISSAWSGRCSRGGVRRCATRLAPSPSPPTGLRRAADRRRHRSAPPTRDAEHRRARCGWPTSPPRRG